MEGLFIEGHLGHGSNSLTNRMDRSRDQGTTPKDSRSSAENPSSSKPKLKEKMSAAPTHSDAQETEGYSRPRTWKDKPGMAKKRKSTKKRQYWEMVEVDDIDDESFEESALSVRDSTSRPKGKSKSKSENGSQRAPINYVISSDADSESESAVETDEEDYEERSKSARTKAKGKGRPKQNLKSPSAKAKKGKKHKNNKKEKKEDKDRAQSQEADIQGLSLSSMENTVYTIDGILSAEYKLSNATGKKSWLYTIKWHGYTIAQTAHEEPIPAEFFGDGEIIEEFWSGVGAKLDVYSTTKTEKGVPVLEPKGKTGERYVASPRSLVKWHIAAYRKYKEESLVFVRRLRRLEKRLENGARLDKKIVTVRGILKKGKEELRAHIADTKREIDINARAARANGEPFDLEEAMEDVSESDIATDYALGETVSTDDDEDYRQVSPARVPTKKRKAIAISLSDSEDLPLTVSRPAPNPASEVVQDTSSGIKLKLPVKASRLEEDRTPKERNLAPWPTKSSGQPKPKLPNSGNNQPSTSLVKEPTSNQDNSLPSASPRNPSERSANELRPKPRKRMKQLVEDSQRTSTGKISVRSLIEGRHPSPSRIQKVTPPTTASPHLEDTMPVTGPANEEQDFVPSASGPLFLDGPEAHAAADSNRRRISWAFGADTPSLDAVRIGRDRYGIPATVSATPNVSALSPPVRSGTQASSRAEDDRQLPSEAARDRSVDLNRPQTLPVGETVPFVKAEPHSPEHKYSGSEGEVEHDLGLDVELDYPGVPEPIVVRDDHRPRPPPETSGVTFHLRFDAPHIGKRTIGKVKLESISDPINLGDPLAMFESLFLGGERELVIDQAITDAGRFLGGQKVNQFARIRPENTESTKEINKLTLLFQNTRQPVGVVRVRSNLLIIVYSSKSIQSAMLNTPKGIQNSGGFTIAALFPNKDLNVHVNPTVRPPSALPPPPLTIRNEPSGPTSLDSANTSAQATSAMVLPPRTGQTTAGFTPGFGRSPSGPVSAIPGSGLDITQPPRRVDTGMRADNTLLPDSNMGKEVDLGLDMDIDMDVDMSLEMDTDLETKQSLATSMPISEPVQPPVKPAQPPVKPADSDDLSDSVRIAPSTHATADQMATSRISEPNLTASDQPISRPEISVEITTPAPPLQQESPLIQHSSSETHTRTPSPEAAPVSVPALQQQNSVQVLEPRLPLLPNSTEEIALVIDGPSSLNSAAVEALDRVITMSPPSKTAEEVPTSPVKRISPSNTLEEPIPVSRIEASLPVPSSTSMAEKAPDSEVQSMPADKAHPSPARVSAASRILDDPVMLLPVVTASPADLSLPAQAPPWVPSLESVPEKAPDSGVGSMQPSTPKPTGGHLESDEMMIPQEALPSIFDHAMQEDTIVLDKPSRVRASGREQTIPSASVDIDMDQADDTELPATRPSGLPPPSNVVELLSPPWPITILPDPPSSPGLAALPTPLALSAPPPPSQSPPPLPDSSLPQDIPAPVSAVTPSIPRSRLPSPSDSLPNTPAVLPGGGRLKVEVVIDQVEFENSKDGYFRRFTNGLDPEDVHPNDLLATFGFTKSFGHHLLNKRCVITTSFAKDELKQLVLEAGGKIVQLNYGVEFDVILVSNDFYPTLAEAQGDVTLSQADIWSFGAADYLNPKDWKLKRHIPKRSGLVSFTASSIIKNPELFLECLRKFHLLSRWNAFLTAETIRSIHNYLKHENTPQTLRLRMFKTMNEATGLFKVRYPRNTDDEDPVLREQRQMVARRIDKLNRWVDVQQEVCKNENLIQMGTLCAQIPEDKMPTNHRKYWERETEILNELADHQSKMDEIYAVKRSIFVGFDTSAIRKGLGNDAISELGFQDVEGYKMDDLFRDLSSDGKFAALLRPSEGIHSEEFE